MNGFWRDGSYISAWLTLVLFATPEVRGQSWEPVQLDDSAFELHAYWDTLTDTVYNFDKNPLIRDLKVVEERKTWKSCDFQAFMPTNAVKIGDIWEVDPNRVLPLLKQFHPGARSQLHHGNVSAPGGWACLSSIGERLVEIHFRVHGEFLLAGDGNTMQSSWFTPAQFKGRMLVEKGACKVSAFQLGVPSQSANVDINLPIGADIGRIPRMELVGGKFPKPSSNVPRITRQASDKLLATKFYRFAEINWHNLPEAWALSVKTGKPLHVIALFGSLDDESC